MKRALKNLAGALLVSAVIVGVAPIAFAQQPAPAASPQTPQTAPANNINAHASERLVDSSIPDDPDVSKMLAVYSPRVHELEVVVGTLKGGELRKGGMGAGSLGNFVTDGMRAQASLKLGKPVDLVVTNGGGLRRSSIPEGELRARDIFELMPFENALVTMELSGEQVLRLLEAVLTSREAQAGARITYIVKPDKTSAIETAKLRDANRNERDIDPKATYTVVTIDYLVERGGDRWAVFREGRNTHPIGLGLRDAIMNYVKAETAAGRVIKPNLDGRFSLNRAGSAAEVPPQ